jgi:hypothetical protein
MEAQLHLLPADQPVPPRRTRRRAKPSAEWRLDESTRARGLRGIAQARSALAQAARHRAESDDTPDQHPSAA